uniref:Virion-associated protein n=1 Tax=Strawberry vein banding virus TaxID=47903 RepID=A0A7G0XYQ6_9VIRU|nr:putative virion associated protein [Strawberry vein banding virus]
MATVTQKTERIYDEILKMEERFQKLEQEQQDHFSQKIDQASATLMAEIKRIQSKLDRCDCNKEILDALKAQDRTKGKGSGSSSLADALDLANRDPPKRNSIKGTENWHPQDLPLTKW